MRNFENKRHSLQHSSFNDNGDDLCISIGSTNNGGHSQNVNFKNNQKGSNIYNKNINGSAPGTSGSGVTLPKWGVKVVIPMDDGEISWNNSGKQGEIDLDVENMDFQDITIVDIHVQADPQAVWDFCVAYACVALGKRANPEAVINIGSNGVPINVGLYYFAALAIFYNIYQCSVGQIPILQMVSKEFKNLMNAATACNRKGYAFTVEWPDSLEAMLFAHQYESYANPLISLAPATGLEDSLGRPLLSTTIPAITLDQINRFGPSAFEEVQRYFLYRRDGNIPLVPYTQVGKYYSNVSMFAVSVNDNATAAIPGVFNVINEVHIPGRDTWLTSLGFYSSQDPNRMGWTARTVQRGTHLALYRLLKDDAIEIQNCSQTLHHMINVSCGMTSTQASLIAAELNVYDDQTLSHLVQEASGASNIVMPNLSTITPGNFMAWYVTGFVRRFWLGAAVSAGTILPDTESYIIGAGTRFVTKSEVDNSMAPRCMTESLGDLSAFISQDGKTLSIPVPTIRGTFLTATLTADSTSNMSNVIKQLYPALSSINFTALFASPVVGDLPSIMPFLTADPFGLTYGTSVDFALESMSSILGILQSQIESGTMNANRDGPKSFFLNMTHYLDNQVHPDGFDLSPLNTVHSVLTSVPINPRALDTVFDSFSSVMFGEEEKIPAYQVIYNRPNRTRVDRAYLHWRQGYLLQFGHKRATAPWGGTNSDLHYFHDTYMEKGGNIFSLLTAPGGILHTGAKLLSQGILDYLGTKESKSRKILSSKVKGKSEDEILDLVSKGEIHPGNLSPVSHGWIDENDYIKAAKQCLSVKRVVKKQKIISPVISAKRVRKRN